MSIRSTKSSSFNLKVIFPPTFPILLLTSLVLHVSDFLFKFGQLLLNVRKHIFYFLGVWTSVEIVVIDTTMRMMFRIVIGSCCFRRHFRRVRKHRHEKTEEKNFTEIFHRESTSENLLQVQVIAITGHWRNDFSTLNQVYRMSVNNLCYSSLTTRFFACHHSVLVITLIYSLQ